VLVRANIRLPVFFKKKKISNFGFNRTRNGDWLRIGLFFNEMEWEGWSE